MKFVIAGGSGFIGQKLQKLLLDEGHEIMILSRKPRKSGGNVTYVEWLEEGTLPENEIGSADAFINLAGVSINGGRWTPDHQKQIYSSRMRATDELIRIIRVLPTKPTVLINASAIGVYPPSIEALYTEKSLEVANDFLGRTVHDWEMKAASLSTDGIRTVFIRLGVVLGKGDGALPLMVLPYKMFVGGTVGSGKQWVSWVHIIDVIRAISFAVENKNIRGPVNVTAPTPMKMKDFGKTIAAVTHRPHWFSIPPFAMKCVLGKKSALVLEGQQVMPEVLRNNGFKFLFPTLESALEDLLIKNKS